MTRSKLVASVLALVVTAGLLSPRFVIAKSLPGSAAAERDLVRENWSHYRDKKTELKKQGYKKDLKGLEFARIDEGFEIADGSIIVVAPVEDKTSRDVDWAKTFMTNVHDEVVKSLQDSKLFKAVKSGGSGDYVARIYVEGLAGQDCIWGIELFKGSHKVAEGYARESTRGANLAGAILFGVAVAPRPIDNLQASVPRKAAQFILRNNSGYNKLYLSKKKM